MNLTINLATEQDTLKLGGNLATEYKTKKGGLIIFLIGELGAGKTTLTRGFLTALGHEGIVKSPTYALVESYTLNHDLNVYHFDFYRLSNSRELEFIGIEDYFNQQAICLIEWPEYAQDQIPLPDLQIHLTYTEIEGRLASLQAHTAKGSILLDGMVHC
ncbi:tRNA (adenosine(37)-N6)-threonylcarbamoyltransferase complex ATPase subunit type 1 TsaE [Candidatus Nitrosacidococcus sp. I8]|uniref:tRNA (adenosine(37)-N6)-threonylcarbamoyltransferase complex ATPase subunit type 1 TsaE n=1 Tax=Candidatus Nitrosacidococcus sp. I8 TaxID=2942908 RepID=UPI0022267936|nr:tRNA (adenosine(37)-N6)-threonylcarbamoyltransferase complex ATPase subunit type 1 TsaE [Candidatus Nitrosacidococcus sp. I8]CAH9017034.1 tRNA threonylcarbamoyladenosine biosynthesis protein TsaE [Candidatus Nitrosacidococcus sp. I8]